MKRLKKILISAVIMLVVLVAGLLHISDAKAATRYFTEGDFSYYVDSYGHAYVRDYDGSDLDVVVPSSAGGYQVYGIRGGAFTYQKVTSITISEGIVYIGQGAFDSCFDLTSITFPSTYVGGDTTYNPIAYVNPARQCTSLSTIIVASGNTHVKVVDGVLFTADMKNIILYPNMKTDATYTIPEGVTYVASGCFEDNRYLTEVVIPDSVTSIGNKAFYECVNLERADIPRLCTYIGRDSFYRLGITEVYINAGLTDIEPGAFTRNEKLQKITVAGNNPKYFDEDGVFYERLKNTNECNLRVYPAAKEERNYTILDNCVSVLVYAFDDAVLDEVIVPDSVKKIYNYAFAAKRISNINIPNGIYEVGGYCFETLSTIDRLVLPYTMTIVPSGTAPSAKCVTFQKNVTEVESQAFCDELATIYFDCPVPKNVETNLFRWSSTHTTVYYPAGDATWQEFIKTYSDARIIFKEHTHTPSAVKQPAVAVTCLYDGYTEGTVCAECGAIISGFNAISHPVDMGGDSFYEARYIDQNVVISDHFCVEKEDRDWYKLEKIETESDLVVNFQNKSDKPMTVTLNLDSSYVIHEFVIQPGSSYLSGAPVHANRQVYLCVKYDGEYNHDLPYSFAYEVSGGTPTKEEVPEHIEGLDCQWRYANGKYYWYEKCTLQGTYRDAKGVYGDGTVRGREIYDPSSDGWYWLDSCYEGAKACNKEVWIPYIYQDENSWDAATIARESKSSGQMAEQVEAAIKNRIGKWVRYDANGKMIKGWYTVEGTDADLYPTQVGNTYYYDPKTGLMAKGWVIIDGVNYFFDEVSGALK